MQLKKLVSDVPQLFPFAALKVFIPLFQIKNWGCVYYRLISGLVGIRSFYSIVNLIVKPFRNKYKRLLVLFIQQDKIKKIPKYLQLFFFGRQNLTYEFPNAAFIPYGK